MWKNNASGGLVDRLRAIVSIYKTCKEQSLEFKIANAKHVYLLRTGLMFESGFPYAASLIYNKPFTLIEF
mgnify:CR=1 FL=1